MVLQPDILIGEFEGAEETHDVLTVDFRRKSKGTGRYYRNGIPFIYRFALHRLEILCRSETAKRVAERLADDRRKKKRAATAATRRQCDSTEHPIESLSIEQCLKDRLPASVGDTK